MIIIRVTAPLLRGLELGEYPIDDPRLKGRGLHWVTEGLVEVASGGEEQTETPPAKSKKAAKS